MTALDWNEYIATDTSARVSAYSWSILHFIIKARSHHWHPGILWHLFVQILVYDFWLKWCKNPWFYWWLQNKFSGYSWNLIKMAWICWSSLTAELSLSQVSTLDSFVICNQIKTLRPRHTNKAILTPRLWLQSHLDSDPVTERGWPDLLAYTELFPDTRECLSDIAPVSAPPTSLLYSVDMSPADWSPPRVW